MPPEHQKYVQWNGERFIHWAGKVGSNTQVTVQAILSGYKVEQQGYKSCMGLLKLADKYTPERLENAGKRALEYTPLSLIHILCIYRNSWWNRCRMFSTIWLAGSI